MCPIRTLFCEDCHAFRPDGTYAGIPKIDKCKECHESAMGSTEDERKLVEDYIEKEQETYWSIPQPTTLRLHAPHC